ncbi:MAG TPA: 6-carboxytetrahydropterin synthase [Anaerohalosphaeraceae bacterium]|nr:6-carboxytetrahydropterin synthase [Anaerohalosphaeraceae bacterium]
MHTLCRQVRFSVNPLGPVSEAGFNSYASKPCGDGLAVYLGLTVALRGRLDEQTGFVVNVSEIDRVVRGDIVPLFERKIRTDFQQARAIAMEDLFDLLEDSVKTLQRIFETVSVNRLILALNPFRNISLLWENGRMRTYKEQFEFAASHRLWNDKFSGAENFQRFGKCANPSGHGHNYILEVSVLLPESMEESGWIGRFQKVVEEHFLSIVDHKNLNLDVAWFSKVNPTVENIASYAWQCLVGKFGQVKLKKITVWENERTSCSYEE